MALQRKKLTFPNTKRSAYSSWFKTNVYWKRNFSRRKSIFIFSWYWATRKQKWNLTDVKRFCWKKTWQIFFLLVTLCFKFYELVATVLTFEAFQFSRMRFCKFSKLFFFICFKRQVVAYSTTKKPDSFNHNMSNSIAGYVQSNHQQNATTFFFCKSHEVVFRWDGEYKNFGDAMRFCFIFLFYTNFSAFFWVQWRKTCLVEAFENLHQYKLCENWKFRVTLRAACQELSLTPKRAKLIFLVKSVHKRFSIFNTNLRWN